MVSPIQVIRSASASACCPMWIATRWSSRPDDTSARVSDYIISAAKCSPSVYPIRVSSCRVRTAISVTAGIRPLFARYRQVNEETIVSFNIYMINMSTHLDSYFLSAYFLISFKIANLLEIFKLFLVHPSKSSIRLFCLIYSVIYPNE